MAEKEKKEKLSQEEIISTEKEIRSCIRCNPKHGGGFIRDLSDEKKARCRLLLKKLGRTELKMDETIVIPGMDVRVPNPVNQRS